MSTERVLLIGYGNPGRLDDGLGPAAAAASHNGSVIGFAINT